VNGEFELLAQRSQERDISATFVTKNEIRPYAEALDVAEVLGESANEAFAALLAKRFIKLYQQERVSAQRLDGSEFLGERVYKRRDAIRRDNCVGMFIEGDNDRERVVLEGVRDGLTDDLLVSEVYAVEEADHQAYAPPAGIGFLRGVDKVHRLDHRERV